MTMNILQRQAAAELRRTYVPPQRYGTAFHITPPYTDVRELPLEKFTIATAASGGSLRSNEQATLAAFAHGDAYAMWHLAHAPQLATHFIRVVGNSASTLELSASGWSSQLHVIMVEPQAQLTILDRAHDVKVGIRRLLVIQAEGSHLTFWGTRTTGEFLTEKVAVYLRGRGAAASLHHLGLVHDQHQVDLSVSVFHEAPDTTSNITTRFAAADRGLAIYRGLISVAPTAHGTKGYQQGRALLLSPTAVVDLLPELAIKTNDVKCSHGVTTTHLDDTALFYLRSRGLTKSQAEKLATVGFFHQQITVPTSIAATLTGSINQYFQRR